MSEYDVRAQIISSPDHKAYVFEVPECGVTVTITTDLRLTGKDDEGSDQQQLEAVFELLRLLPEMLSKTQEAEVLSRLFEDLEQHLKEASE